MPETYLLQADTGLKISNTYLIAFCKTWRTLKRKWRKLEHLTESTANKRLKLSRNKRLRIRTSTKYGLEELPDADGNDPSSTEI